ncbi:MAG: IMP dehydrogenase [Paracoccaceae bacterium]
MKLENALTFDDVLLVPAKSSVTPDMVNTETFVTKNIKLNIPLISSAMDTVTETNMAIAMAQCGGIGVIHRNLSVSKQVKYVSAVKRFESGIVYNPITLNSDDTVKTAKKIAKRYNITSFPIVDKEKKILGILTNRDIRFLEDNSIKVSEIMTKENLATVREPITSFEAKKIMAKRRIEKLLIVNENNCLSGLLTIKDIEKSVLNPLACKDELGRLRCAAASSVGDEGYERSVSLIDSGVDIIVIDTAHGHSADVIEAVKRIKKEFINTQIIAGNVVTSEATKELIDIGADGIKVGIGPGSICTTRIIAGVGMPQLSAIINCVKEANMRDIPVIADGGIRFSGDFAKSIASGASCAMIGSLLAGTDESPGEIYLYKGRSFKNYRGMGSLGAMARGSADRYFQKDIQADKLIPEGIEGQVPYKGPVNNIIYQLVGGLKASMGYTGNENIKQMKKNCNFIKISGAGLSESHVHDVRITNESPNYSNN